MSKHYSWRLFVASFSIVGGLATAYVAPAVAEPSLIETIDEIVVTADFRERSLREIPASVVAMDADYIRENSTQHFEELINSIANLNWSGDGHRARYFQIRGVGELEQYQGAPNPSIGFLIDDIDFSGIATVATVFDVESVEVLRGPQGTRYGANALGGLIYMRSAAPSAERDAKLQMSVGDDDLRSIGMAFGGALNASESATFRASAQHHQSNGFRNNAFLGRDDTNGREETTVRARLRLQLTPALLANIAVLYADINNGYDAFSLDNSYSVLSDKPGKDAQTSTGASVKLEWSLPDDRQLTSITAIADSDIEFSFDADWGNDVSWAPITYDYTSSSHRQRKTISQELRLQQDNWLFGVYALKLDDEIRNIDTGEYFDADFPAFADSFDGPAFLSDYEAISVAVFGQRDFGITEKTTVSVGLRSERRLTDYSDSRALQAGPSESMWGGSISIRNDYSNALSSYVAFSKGYKAGGFNLGPAPVGRRDFGAEDMYAVEVGVKGLLFDGRLSVNSAVFINRRDNQQVRTSDQLDPNNPATFVFFTDNVAEGDTYGAEFDVRWFVSDAVEIYANVGLLDASFDGGRALAHAPDYTIAAGVAYRNDSGFFARLDANAKDAFYFDVSHDQRSQSYELLNARIGFESENWLLSLWARNLADTDYAVRGFFFGNEPPNFPNTLYTRQGDPRQLGVTVERRFF